MRNARKRLMQRRSSLPVEVPAKEPGPRVRVLKVQQLVEELHLLVIKLWPVVGYHKKGYPKQDPNNDCLDFVKIETS